MDWPSADESTWDERTGGGTADGARDILRVRVQVIARECMMSFPTPSALRSCRKGLASRRRPAAQRDREGGTCDVAHPVNGIASTRRWLFAARARLGDCGVGDEVAGGCEVEVDVSVSVRVEVER